MAQVKEHVAEWALTHSAGDVEGAIIYALENFGRAPPTPPAPNDRTSPNEKRHCLQAGVTIPAFKLPGAQVGQRQWDSGSGGCTAPPNTLHIPSALCSTPLVHCTSPQHCTAPLWYTAHPLSTIQHPSECFSLSMLKTHKHLQVDIEPPDHLCCPLTLTLLDDPISGPDGRTYSRAAITKALALKEVLVLCAFATLPLPYCLCLTASAPLPLSHCLYPMQYLCRTASASLSLPHCLCLTAWYPGIPIDQTKDVHNRPPEEPGCGASRL